MDGVARRSQTIPLISRPITRIIELKRPNGKTRIGFQKKGKTAKLKFDKLKIDTVSLPLSTHEGRKDRSSMGHLQEQKSTIVRAYIKRTRMDGNIRQAQTIHSI
jgi:hypothetical protein